MTREKRHVSRSAHQILLPDKEKKKSAILSITVSPVTSVAPVRTEQQRNQTFRSTNLQTGGGKLERCHSDLGRNAKLAF